MCCASKRRDIDSSKCIRLSSPRSHPFSQPADMREARSEVIEISGITSAAMSDLVDYFYTGTAPNLKSLANELLDVSNRYQIDRLFKMREGCRKRKMAEAAYVTDTPVQADLYGREKLKKACFEFISVNTTKISCEEWKRLKDRSLSLYLQDAIYPTHVGYVVSYMNLCRMQYVLHM